MFAAKVPPTIPYISHDKDATRIVADDTVSLCWSRERIAISSGQLEMILANQGNVKDLVFAVSTLFPQPKGMFSIASRLWQGTGTYQSVAITANRQLDIITEAAEKLESETGLIERILKIRDPGRSSYFGEAPPPNSCLSILNSNAMDDMVKIVHLLDYSKVELEELFDAINLKIQQNRDDYTMIHYVLQQVAVLLEHCILLRAVTNHSLAVLAGFPGEFEELQQESYLSPLQIQPPPNGQLGFRDLRHILDRIDMYNLSNRFDGSGYKDVSEEAKAVSEIVWRLQKLGVTLQTLANIEKVITKPEGFEAVFVKEHEAHNHLEWLVQEQFSNLMDLMGLLGYGRVIARLSSGTAQQDVTETD